MSLYTAQTVDDDARKLDTAPRQRWPREALPAVLLLRDQRRGERRLSNCCPFNSNVFDLYGYWGRPGGDSDALDQDDDGASPTRRDTRREVARGETLFNTLPIAITGVAGLNDDLGIATLNGTCTTCHDTPSSGNHSIPAPLNIGLTDASRRTPDLPLYTLRNLTTGQTTQTTDPGRALLTGKWKDIGRFKGPILRALAARAPYFHNGFAASLDEVVEFYNSRFALSLTTTDKIRSRRLLAHALNVVRLS